ADVKAGAAADDRQPSARGYFGDALPRTRQPLRDIETGGDRHFPNKMVRRARANFRRWLCAEDIEPRINLECIGADDFAADTFRERDREFAFPHGSRTEEEKCPRAGAGRHVARVVGMARNFNCRGSRTSAEASCRSSGDLRYD